MTRPSRKRLALAVTVVITLHTQALHAQVKSSYPVVPVALPDEQEIEVAISAAPPEISINSAVYTVRNGKIVVIRAGKNGTSCMVARDFHAGSQYPICFDAEGTRTHLWRELHELRLRMKAVPESAIRDSVNALYARNELQPPTTVTVTYMLSPQQVLFSEPGPDGRKVGSWWPHLMISWPGMTSAALGLTDAQQTHSFGVSGEGGRRELIVKLPKWGDGTAVKQE